MNRILGRSDKVGFRLPYGVGLAIAQTGFVPPVPLEQALEQTIRYEFMEDHDEEGVFYSE